MRISNLSYFLSTFSLIAVFILFVYTCNPRQKEESKKDDLASDFLGRELIFPESLNMSIRNDISLTQIINNNKNKIVVFFNTDCSVCSLELGEWQKYIEEHQQYTVDYIFIATGSEKEYMEYIVFDKINFKEPIFFDANNDFFQWNNLPNTKFHHTMLINKKNQIVLVGSPIGNDNIMKEYNKHLTSYSNE